MMHAVLPIMVCHHDIFQQKSKLDTGKSVTEKLKSPLLLLAHFKDFYFIPCSGPECASSAMPASVNSISMSPARRRTVSYPSRTLTIRIRISGPANFTPTNK